MTDRMRVIIADDHPPTRAGIRQALEAGGFTVCAEAGSAAEAIETALKERPDVCLLDIHMPGTGIRAAERITSQLPETVVVMLTVSQSDADLFDALLAGAAGYLLKDMDPDRLPEAVRGVLSGEAALPRPLMARVLEEFRVREGRKRLRVFGDRRGGLTSREWEVLQLLRDGLSTSDIAKRLFVSPVTVRTHVSAILKKLRVPDREAAIKLFDEA
jgi:DNA-binding NarL/FixJ family response regulator